MRLSPDEIDAVRIITHSRPKSKNKKVISKVQFRDRKNFSLIKRLFNYKCQSCGYSLITSSGKKIIQIAHIIPHHLTRDNRLENLLVLCSRCHLEFDFSDKRFRILSRIRRKFPMINYTDPDLQQPKELLLQ